MYIDQIDVFQKKVLVRVDFNVPLDEKFNVTDDTRIKGALPTIKYLIDNKCKVILMSHLGRPLKKTLEDGSIDKNRFTLKHTLSALQDLIDAKVYFADETIGVKVEEKVNALNEGEILILENTRFHKAEKEGDEAFSKALSALADVYINDAFGTAHRAHASTCVVANYFEKGAKAFGFLIQKELEAAIRLTDNPQRPFTAIVGGAKVSDKILLLEKLLDNVDSLIIGGGMAYTLIKAQNGEIGNSLFEADKLETAKRFLNSAEAKGVKILLPEDSIVADKFAENATKKTMNSYKIESGWMGLDIGAVACKQFSEEIMKSKTLVWNGPMGVFEFDRFSKGTYAIADAVVKATENNAFSLIGGGDSVAAINKAGKADFVSFVSTGGGAMLKLLEGGTLPGIQAIID